MIDPRLTTRRAIQLATVAPIARSLGLDPATLLALADAHRRALRAAAAGAPATRRSRRTRRNSR